jgi:AraC family transcriptional regulator of adaptative response/methylated-DNA-[protein]-cysteine methyltransferase
MTLAAGNTALAAAIECDVRWASIAARDRQADGRFYYSVKTTGVYCWPACPHVLQDSTGAAP